MRIYECSVNWGMHPQDPKPWALQGDLEPLLLQIGSIGGIQEQTKRAMGRLGQKNAKS